MSEIRKGGSGVARRESQKASLAAVAMRKRPRLVQASSWTPNVFLYIHLLLAHPLHSDRVSITSSQNSL